MSNTNPERVNVLHEAADLIVGQRQKDYGTPEENFQRIANFWNIHLEKNLVVDISARQVAEMMLLLKLARTINSPTRDTYVDAGGYAGIAAELADNELNNKTPSLYLYDEPEKPRAGDVWVDDIFAPTFYRIWDGSEWEDVFEKWNEQVWKNFMGEKS